MSLSIGKTDGIGYDPISRRWKGMISRILRNTQEIEHELVNCVRETNGDGTRFTARIFTTLKSREALCNVGVFWRERPLRCEAFIPTTVGGIAYFGGNTSDRSCDERVVSEERKLLENATREPPKKRGVPAGFKIERLHHARPVEIEDLAAVYAASYTKYITEFTFDTISRMVYENVVVVARNAEGRIVAVSQGETAEIPEVGLRLIELSDTATHPDYRSQGLTTFCKLELLRRLEAPDTVIFAESRAVSGGVLRQNHSVGMRVAGRLERHCRIASQQEDLHQEGEYGNMVVFYHPGS